MHAINWQIVTGVVMLMACVGYMAWTLLPCNNRSERID